jgi:hypothetical protein
MNLFLRDLSGYYLNLLFAKFRLPGKVLLMPNCYVTPFSISGLLRTPLPLFPTRTYQSTATFPLHLRYMQEYARCLQRAPREVKNSKPAYP